MLLEGEDGELEGSNKGGGVRGAVEKEDGWLQRVMGEDAVKCDKGRLGKGSTLVGGRYGWWWLGRKFVDSCTGDMRMFFIDMMEWVDLMAGSEWCRDWEVVVVAGVDVDLVYSWLPSDRLRLL